MAKDKIGTERRSESAKWESKEVGLKDFSCEDCGSPASTKKVAGTGVETEQDRVFNLLEK